MTIEQTGIGGTLTRDGESLKGWVMFRSDACVIRFEEDDWRALGSPEQIAVTIERAKS